MGTDQILLVEDDPDILYIATKKLRAAGYTVLPAASGLEALHCRLDNPACRRMVTDFVMPSLGGDYWIRFLERFCPDWTIVVVSSENVDSGRFVIVPKPADYDTLLDVFARNVVRRDG